MTAMGPLLIAAIAIVVLDPPVLIRLDHKLGMFALIVEQIVISAQIHVYFHGIKDRVAFWGYTLYAVALASLGGWQSLTP